MRFFLPTRAALPLAGLLLAGLGAEAAEAQNPSALPSNAATSTQTLTTGTAGPVATVSSSHKAVVEYTGGLLHITANNSSLNQILREVARLTGMKITGGVAEDRVFGSYGPASADSVLTSLLDGTSSNVLIVQNASAGPAELILTPRKGEPTPPNPNSLEGDVEPQRDLPRPSGATQPRPQQQAGQLGPPRRSLAPDGIGPLPPSNGGQTGTPIDGGADIGQVPGAFTPAGQTPPDITAQPVTDPQANTTAPVDQPEASHGTITPQQIYEQLQRLKQQQTAAPE